MFGPDPINFFDPSPYGALAYYGHYLFGTVVLLASLIALIVKKGRGTHRTAGLVFIFGTALLSLTSVSMLIDRFIPPLMMAVVSSVCAIGGAYLALQKPTRWVRTSEYALTLAQAVGLAVFLSIAIPEAAAGRIPVVAPIVIAVIPLILLAGDALWYARSSQRQRYRIARHLSRMIWGFVIVLRAPMVEIAAAGVPIPVPVTIIGPILLAFAMLAYFLLRYAPSSKGV